MNATLHFAEKPSDDYTQGYRAGFVKGYEDGIQDGRFQGFKDAKRLALQAVKDDYSALQAVEFAVGEQ